VTDGGQSDFNEDSGQQLSLFVCLFAENLYKADHFVLTRHSKQTKNRPVAIPFSKGVCLLPDFDKCSPASDTITGRLCCHLSSYQCGLQVERALLSTTHFGNILHLIKIIQPGAGHYNRVFCCGCSF
jgi:hypothetical protein